MGAFKKHHFGPSRSDSDWRAAKALKNFAGFVFVCSRSTFPDQERGIFGLPGCYEECVRNIHRGMPIFLFNRSDRRLYGVFEAASDGGYNIDPHAWEDTEQSKSWRYTHPISKFPAQVRVSTMAQRLFLEEESFRSVLDYEEGTKFRLELTASQVQQLLLLFDAAQAAKRESFVERNRVNQNASRDPESPRPTTKSDSDSYSDCSSRGLNSCDDEWTDEAACENVRYRHGDTERLVSERLHQIAVDDCQPYDKGHLIPAAREDRVGAGYYNDKEMAWKRPSQKSSLCFGSDSDNAMRLRLHETDPAVNSNSNHCVQTGVDLSLAQDDAVTMPMISSSQMEFPFACNDNMIFIPVQKVPYQQRENAAFLGGQSQRSKWSDQKRYARGGSMNSRKQGFNQDRSHKSSKDARYQSQQRLPEIAPLQSLKPQFNQLLVPLCSQGPSQAQQDPAQLPTPLPPLMMPPSEGLTFAQQQQVEESAPQGFGVANNVQVTPEEVQRFLQNGHFPPFLMPPIIHRPAAGPQPITAGFVEALHFEVLQFARWTRPSEEVQLHVEAAIDCVRKGVKMVWPEADVEVFGSFATGLCLQHSDVDLVVIDAPTIPSAGGLSIAQASASLIRDLAAALRTYEWCESIKPLDTASMPVLKCLCRPFGGASANTQTAISSIAVDITIGGMRNSHSSWNPAAQVLDTTDQVPTPGKFRHTGGAAREYVFHKIQELPALAPLVLLLKSFLHHKNLSNVYLGGLGSFSLTLLVAFYLERVAATRDVFSNRSSGDSPTSHTLSPASCSSDLSDDSDAPSPSCNLGALNWNGGSDYSGHSLGERYVRRAADAIQKVLSLWDQDGSPYLGTLLLGFLQTFGFQLDLSRERIVLKGIDGNPGGFFKRDDRHVALWIDDPLRPGVNIGAGSFGMIHVQTAFKEMLQALTKRSVFSPPLKCHDKDCLDLATIRQLAHIGCIARETDDF